ncbi:Uncharacterised protein [Legionella wadsworthii]|uniref:Uncharacterized protein n=1 Tax=Legionella wadsworthii TaxID=28088 RepID=A0A378LXT4_9GAMM|nr:hypothetical protein [Legionella wadsworthii]STY31250.1 Uncharacterised protein [Legionella wadsworthii]
MKKEKQPHDKKALENMGLGKLKPDQLKRSHGKGEKSDYEGGPEKHPGKGL